MQALQQQQRHTTAAAHHRQQQLLLPVRHHLVPRRPCVRAHASDPQQQQQQPSSSPPAAPPTSSSSSSSSRGPAAFNDSIPEAVFDESSASNAELLINILLAATLVWIPLTIAVVGKKLWIKYIFTNKRVKVVNTSPLFAREVEVSYKAIKEVRTAPRAFGLWGDMVIFMKDGSRLEITGLERYQDIKRHILSSIYD